MDIIPSDLATFGNEAKNLLQDLQSRNERMFLLTFLVVNMADTKRKLENDIFAAAGIAQKYNCRLTRLDYQQDVYKRQLSEFCIPCLFLRNLFYLIYLFAAVTTK